MRSSESPVTSTWFVTCRKLDHTFSTLTLLTPPLITMHPINVWQTTGRAIVVIHATGASPPTVHLPPSQEFVKLDYHHEVEDKTLLREESWTIQPLLGPIDSEERGQPTTVKDSSVSVSAENIVLAITKPENTEWQALLLVSKSSLVQRVGDCVRPIPGQHVQTESKIVRFVTSANAEQLLYATRAEEPWESEQAGPHVNRVQARRVPNVNAIEVTAELVHGVLPETLQCP